MILLYIILVVYIVMIGALSFGFFVVKNFEANTSITPKTAFTIVVPFRNEEHNLPKLLKSITQLNYPSYLINVILIDDASDFEFIIPLSSQAQSKDNILIIPNNRKSNSPKKDAITTAIPHVTTDWVITTDADCIAPKNWLFTLDNYIQQHDVSMIAGAVTYAAKNTFLDAFQQLDLTSLQGATIGSFGIKKGFMCNGANFGYTKSFFIELNGFEGNDKIASGDDVFLLQKAIKKAPKKVHYLKSQENSITTQPTKNWTDLFHQRVRWAAKTSSYESHFGKFLGIVVFLGNLSIVLCWFGFLIDLLSFDLWLTLFILKLFVDTFLLFHTNQFLTKKRMRYFLLSNVFYPFFSVSVALYSLFGSYKWKGRSFKI